MRIPVSLPPVWIVLADHMKNVATLHRFVLNSNNFFNEDGVECDVEQNYNEDKEESKRLWIL